MAKAKAKIERKKILRYFRYRVMLKDRKGNYGWLKGTCEVTVYDDTDAKQKAQGEKKVWEHLRRLHGKALIENPEEIIKGQMLESCRPNTNRIEMV